MKKIFLFLPATVLIIAACTSPPKSTTLWRVGSLANHGNRIALLPLDVRVHTKGVDKGKKNKIWEKSMNNGYALMKALPSLLESRNFSVTHQLMWSGLGVDEKGLETPMLSDSQMARVFLSMSGFAGSIINGPLKHSAVPDVFRSLSSSADLTLYSAQWTNYKHSVDGGKVFLKTLGIILVVVVVAVIVVALVAASGKGGGGGKGGIFSGMGRLFGAGAKGAARATGTVAKAVAQTAGRAAIQTARVAARVTFRVMIENGPIVVDIPEGNLEPVYAQSELPSQEPETCNRYLGVYHGISPLRPVFEKYGMFYAFALVENKTGRIVWDARIFIPQGADTKGLDQKLKAVFASLPSYRMAAPALQ